MLYFTVEEKETKAIRGHILETSFSLETTDLLNNLMRVLMECRECELRFKIGV